MKCFNILFFIAYLITANIVSGLKLTPGPVSCEYKGKDVDDSYDTNSDVTISCSGSSCTVKGSGATARNGEVVITAAGTYIISGSLQGHVLIQANGEEDFVHIVLNSATISSTSGPAIYGETVKKVTITLVGSNKLTDTQNYTVVEDEPDGCIFVDADLSINGSGSLSVTGNYSDAIRSKKDLKLVSGNISIPKAVKKGIKARNSICVLDATLDIVSGEAAIKATKDTDPEKGYIVIDGGKITISSQKKGIQAETHLTINGGFIDIKNSYEGIEGQMIDILGGEIHVFSTNDGINAPDPENTTGWPTGQAQGNVYINIVGGKVYVHVKGNELDCIDANGTLYIGGDAEVYVSMNGGSIYGFFAALDADEELYLDKGATIIATAGGSGSGGFGGFGGGGFWKRHGLKKRQWNGGNTAGGWNMGGGNMGGNMGGGNTAGGWNMGGGNMGGNMGGGNAAGGWNMGGGNMGGFGGFGGGGMTGMLEGKCYQPSISITVSNQSENTPISVKDSRGTLIASYTPPNPYGSILITSPKLVAGQTYTIVTGNTQQNAVAGDAEVGNPNPPSVTTPNKSGPNVASKTDKTNKNNQASNNNNTTSNCSSKILAMGYKCCKSGCQVQYRDADGEWGVEDNQWCGCGLSSKPTCSEAIIKQGYNCCVSQCEIVYSDNDGNWGVENNQWCGIPSNC